MTLKLNHVMITCESHKCFFGDFSVPLAKLRSPNFFKTNNNTNVSVVRGSLHLEAGGTCRSSDQTRRNLQLPTDIDSQNNPRKPSILDHSNCVEMAPEKAEIFKSMEDWATHSLLPLLKPAKECWQPQDLLPDPTSEGFHDQIREIRARTHEIPDEYFVVLVGDMVTEEALPTYQSRLNGTQVFRDETGVDDTPWAVWARGWSAEENRHGDLLNKYLYLSGRVDMKQVQTTIQYLIGSGVDIGTGNNPYLWTIYTSFQERATAISHGNTAKLATQHGDTKLAQICGTIASDEKRHESAYSKIAAKLFEIDPSGMAVALAAMMKRKISMPAHLLYDGRDHNLFKHFSDVASRLGVYTATDYRHILEHLVAKWNVENLTGLSSDAREAQDYVCGLPQRIKRLEDRALLKAQQAPPVSFSWIFDRSV